MNAAVVLMGVSGSGKTSVGEALSQKLGWPFFDGDDFHPEANVSKMSQGIPLNDDDRRPWLDSLHQMLVEHLDSGKSLLLACSALKASYRQILVGGRDDIFFVYLKGDYNLIWARMQRRSSHYMKAEMLQSQFNDLEEPQTAMVVPIDQPISDIVDALIKGIEKIVSRPN